MMHPKKFENVVSMAADDRYWYLIRRVADAEEVWLLATPTGSPMTIEVEPGSLVYPIWPEREFAEAAARARPEWGPVNATTRPLDEFMERWLPGMQRDGHKVGVFWVGPDLLGIDVEPAVLLQELKEECAQYAD
jgi:hypothetical protein